jgi:hypothetical protein
MQTSILRNYVDFDVPRMINKASKAHQTQMEVFTRELGMRKLLQSTA